MRYESPVHPTGIQYTAQTQKLGFGCFPKHPYFYQPALHETKLWEIKGLFGTPQQPRVQPCSLLSSALQHFGVWQLLGHGQQIPAQMAAPEVWGVESRAERTSSGNQKLSQPASRHLYVPLAVCVISQLGACSLHWDAWNLPPALRKASTIAFPYSGMGNATKAEKTCSFILGNLLRGLYNHLAR